MVERQVRNLKVGSSNLLFSTTMKKIIIILASALICMSADAFTVRNHATVAYIAEKNLNSKARKQVAEILHGNHLYEYSSWPDFFRLSMLDEKGKQIGHMYAVDENYSPIPLTAHKSAYTAVKEAAERLKNDRRNMTDSARIADLSIIIHLMGDLHCPSHIRFADNRNKTVKNVIYNMNGKKGADKKVKYHSYWDDFATNTVYCGGYLDLAQVIDIYGKKEIKEFQKGTLEDWCHDCAVSCKDVYNIEDNAKIDRRHVVGDVQLVKIQICKAGYRLAKLLNDTLGK